MAKKYVVIGIHTRWETNKDTKQKELKIFNPGDIMEPTKFELTQFPNKFQPYDEPVEDEKSNDNGGENLNTTALEEARAKLQIVAESDEWEDSVIAEATNLLKKQPQKQNTIDALVNDMEKFLATLEDDDDENDDNQEGGES